MRWNDNIGMETMYLGYSRVSEVDEIEGLPSRKDRMSALFNGSVVRVMDRGVETYFKFDDRNGLSRSLRVNYGFTVLVEPYDFTDVLEEYNTDNEKKEILILPN